MTKIYLGDLPLTDEQYELGVDAFNGLTVEEIGLLSSLLQEYRQGLRPRQPETFLNEVTKVEALNQKLNGLLVQALCQDE